MQYPPRRRKLQIRQRILRTKQRLMPQLRLTRLSLAWMLSMRRIRLIPKPLKMDGQRLLLRGRVDIISGREQRRPTPTSTNHLHTPRQLVSLVLTAKVEQVLQSPLPRCDMQVLPAIRPLLPLVGTLTLQQLTRASTSGLAQRSLTVTELRLPPILWLNKDRAETHLL